MKRKQLAKPVLQIHPDAIKTDVDIQEKWDVAVSQLTDNQRKFMTALPEHLTVKRTCRAIKILPAQFYHWMQSSPPFRTAYHLAMQMAVPAVEMAHFEAAMGKDTLARIHILKSRHPSYFEGDRVNEYGQVKSAGNAEPVAVNENPRAAEIMATALAKAIDLLGKSGFFERHRETPVVDVDAEVVEKSDKTEA